MSEEKAVVVQPDVSLEEWGDRDNVAALARRLRAMLPGGNKLTEAQALAVAQYSILTDSNPFRGEVYAYDDKGKLTLVEGYKLLVRWAKQQCPYTEWYKSEELSGGGWKATCYILRQDQHSLVQAFIAGGATWNEAREAVATSAVGIVTQTDMRNRDGYDIPAPKGWTWEDVAKKRALKNALNRSHGAPSPREIAAESWKVGDTETEPRHWVVAADQANGHISREDLARAAESVARDEKLREQLRQMSPAEKEAMLNHNREILRGDSEDAIEAELQKERPTLPATRVDNGPEWTELGEPDQAAGGEAEPAEVAPRKVSPNPAHIQAIVSGKYAENSYIATAMLNLLDITPDMDVTRVLRGAKAYRESRDNGGEKAEAAAIGKAALSAA